MGSLVDIGIEPIKTSYSGKGKRSSLADIGLVHEGVHSVEDMIIAEDRDSFLKSLFFRVILLCWSAWMTSRTYVLKKVFRHSDMTKLHVPIPTQIALTSCVWCTFVGLTFLFIWGGDW